MKCIVQLVAVGHADMNQSPSQLESTSESCSPSWSSFGAVLEFQEPLVEEAFKETFSLIGRISRVSARVSRDLCNIECEACQSANGCKTGLAARFAGGLGGEGSWKGQEAKQAFIETVTDLPLNTAQVSATHRKN